MLSTLFPDESENGENDNISLPQDKAIGIYNKMKDHCLLELKDADKTNAIPATKILCQALTASGEFQVIPTSGMHAADLLLKLGILAHHLVPVVFEHVLDAYKSPDKVQQRSALFQIMGHLVKALQASPGPLGRQALSAYREEVLSLAASNLGTSSTQEQALFCLAQLTELTDCLSHQELVFALQSITDVLVKPDEDTIDDMAANALDALDSLTKLYPSDIEEITLPPLMQLLPDVAPSREDTSGIAEYRVALASLATLCISPTLFETFLIRILSRVERLSRPSTDVSQAQQQTILYCHHLLTTLRVVIEKKIKADHKDIQTCASRVIHHLFGLFVNRNQDPSSVTSVATSTKLIGDAGRIITLLVQQMDERYARLATGKFETWLIIDLAI